MAFGRAVPGRTATPETPICIGVLNDMAGAYSDYQRAGSVVAAQLAIEDFGGNVGNRPIELLVGDHQNKPDIGALSGAGAKLRR
jgi:branched-chain amino acid transport system substrate-binding protein